MPDEEIRNKILKFLSLRKQAGIFEEQRVSHLPSMIGITPDEFEKNIEYLHQNHFVEADAALRLDGGMSYLRIRLIESRDRLSVTACAPEPINI